MRQALISSGADLDIADKGERACEEVGDSQARPTPTVQRRTLRGGLECECLRRARLQQATDRRARGEQRGDVSAGRQRGLQHPEVVVPEPAAHWRREGEAVGDRGR